VDLDSWFEDREIQEFIEKLEKKSNKITIRSNLQNQQIEKQSSTKTTEDFDNILGNIDERRLPWPGGIKQSYEKVEPKEIEFNEDYFKKKPFEFYNFKNYKFDPSVIRGLEYYTGPIFEVNLNFQVKNSKGQTIQFGSIGGGGRYDNLVSNFGNLDCPATGISIGLDRLVFALMQKKDFKIKSTRPVIICVFDKNNVKEYIDILNKLRASNISSEIYPGEGKLKKQMEYANKLGSPAVILYGDNEIKSGKVTLKNLESGNESSVKIEEIANEIKKLL